MQPRLCPFWIDLFEMAQSEQRLQPLEGQLHLPATTVHFEHRGGGEFLLQGGEHEINAARYVLYETCKLLNKVFKQRQGTERLATLDELRTSFTPQMRFALVLLDDELSYLFMWSPAVHNYCRPERPDVT